MLNVFDGVEICCDVEPAEWCNDATLFAGYATVTMTTTTTTVMTVSRA